MVSGLEKFPFLESPHIIHIRRGETTEKEMCHYSTSLFACREKWSVYEEQQKNGCVVLGEGEIMYALGPSGVELIPRLFISSSAS